MTKHDEHCETKYDVWDMHADVRICYCALRAEVKTLLALLREARPAVVAQRVENRGYGDNRMYEYWTAVLARIDAALKREGE